MKYTFIVDRKDISHISFEEASLPSLNSGEVLLRVEKAALTANNITYAVLGDRFRYWNFFPDDRGGIVPVWGFGSVVESKVKDLPVGKRYYGYFPMSSHLVVQPTRINKYGMVDGAEHRTTLPGVYNYYEEVNQKRSDDKEASYMIYQPLFATSFLLEDYYREHGCFGAEALYLTSASSKTAIAFAFLVKKNNPEIQVIGLTSTGNKSFCFGLGIYDQILGYDEIKSIGSESSCIIDFAGNNSVLRNLQVQLGKALLKCSTVGLSHWDQSTSEEPLPFKSELFFAPDHAKKRQEEWGGKAFKVKLDGELYPFLDWVLGWIKLTASAKDGILEKYLDVLGGNVKPDQSIVLEF
jgi:hypothetical protein